MSQARRQNSLYFDIAGLRHTQVTEVRRRPEVIIGKYKVHLLGRGLVGIEAHRYIVGEVGRFCPNQNTVGPPVKVRDSGDSPFRWPVDSGGSHPYGGIEARSARV